MSNTLYTPIGILGGTFDPIHYGHLRIAETLLDQLELESIYLIPCATPPHRHPPQATGAQRLRMIQLAIQNHSKLFASDIELMRVGPSYMVDTLSLLCQQYPQKAYCLIIGSDVFQSFNQWQQFEKIPSLAHLIIVNRQDFSFAPQQPAWLQDLLKPYQLISDPEYFRLHKAGGIFFAKMSIIPISATQIRELLQRGEKLKNTLPQKVFEYIQQQHLYQVNPP